MGVPYHKDFIELVMKYSIMEPVVYDPILGEDPSRPLCNIHIRLPHCFLCNPTLRVRVKS